MCTAVEETKIESILAVMNTTEQVAQLVERCTVIAEVMGSNPIRA